MQFLKKTMEKLRKFVKNFKFVKIEKKGTIQLFSMRTKLSYYKFFHRKLVGYINKKNSNVH